VSDTLRRVIELVLQGEVRISEHGYDELAADLISVRDIIDGIQSAEPVEDYPNYAKGACVLVLQQDHDGEPLHALWGIPRGAAGPAVLVTAYRPDSTRLNSDLRRRMK
jgi:hypothetical protein